MVAIIGRRRVGKTFLIRLVYENRIDFELTGTQNVPQLNQIKNFQTQLRLTFGAKVPKAKPSNWRCTARCENKNHLHDYAIYRGNEPLFPSGLLETVVVLDK